MLATQSNEIIAEARKWTMLISREHVALAKHAKVSLILELSEIDKMRMKIKIL